jgi:hypothetical protein
MDITSTLGNIKAQVAESTIISKTQDGMIIQLPFKDFMGESIEIHITETSGKYVFDDFGRTAGLLFSMDQHTEYSQGHQLVKHLSSIYKIDMDYNEGILSRTVANANMDNILNFAEVLISFNTVIPYLQKKKRLVRHWGRLNKRLSTDIIHLKAQDFVDRHVQIAGRNEMWTIDYRYTRRFNGDSANVMIVTADLNTLEPRYKAEHILALATDILDTKKGKDIRVVYDTHNHNNNLDTESPSCRAANLIESYKKKIGYTAYNYANPDHKAELRSLTTLELSNFVLADKTD